MRSGSISLDFPLSLADDSLSITMALRQVRRLTLSTMDDHATLRWSHTIINTRMKNIWSMTDSRWCLDRLGGDVGVPATASSRGMEGDCCRDGDDCERLGDWGTRKDFDDHVLILGSGFSEDGGVLAAARTSN